MININYYLFKFMFYVLIDEVIDIYIYLYYVKDIVVN